MKRKMNHVLNKTKLSVVILITSILVIGGYFIVKDDSTSRQRGTNTVSQKAALAVEVVRPQAVDWPMTITLNGSVYPWQEAIVSAEISGLRIRQIQTDVGQIVKRGQVLALLADETVIADLQKQEATVEKNKAALAEATSNANRAREIASSGALSAQKINEYQIAEQTAKADLALAVAELENQRIRLRQTRVVAPDDGVLTSRSATLGNVVSAGTELFRLMRQGRVEWRGEATASQLVSIHDGQSVQLLVPGKTVIKGKVRLTSPTVDTNTRNALIYVELPKGSVKPGMYLQGTINIGTQSGMAVPLSAVVYRDGNPYVFEISDPNAQGLTRIIQRKVVTGRTKDDAIELVSGVENNVRLVKTGGAFLNDGDTVKVMANAINVSGAAQ